MKICLVGVEVFGADRQRDETDKHDEANSRFSQLFS